MLLVRLILNEPVNFYRLTVYLAQNVVAAAVFVTAAICFTFLKEENRLTSGPTLARHHSYAMPWQATSCNKLNCKTLSLIFPIRCSFFSLSLSALTALCVANVGALLCASAVYYLARILTLLGWLSCNFVFISLLYSTFVVIIFLLAIIFAVIFFFIVCICTHTQQEQFSQVLKVCPTIPHTHQRARSSTPMAYYINLTGSLLYYLRVIRLCRRIIIFIIIVVVEPRAIRGNDASN